MKKLSLLILSAITLATSAQKTEPGEHSGWELSFPVQEKAISSKRIAEDVQELDQLIQAQAGYSEDITLQESYQRQAKAFDHYSFQLYKNGVRIYGAQAKVSVDKQGKLRQLQFPLLNNSSDNSEFPALSLAANILSRVGGNQISDSEQVWLRSPDGYLTRGLRVEISGPDAMHREIVYNQGEIVYNQNLNKHFHQHLEGPNDTLVDVYVYDPDPLSTAEQSYGGNYSDRNDADSPQLTAERKLRQTIFSYVNGSFMAENDYVKISEFSLPNVTPVTNSQPIFDFTRSENHFEDVNVMYHITEQRKHLIGLGYPNLPSYAIEVDAHALSGADQSFFSTAVYPYRLYFGEGGVDDAEDADVIIHEFSHAVIYEAAPTFNFTTERGCIEEALCDYFAISLSKTLGNYNSDKVFNWDGHNSYWSGRNGKTSLNYKNINFAAGNIYLYTSVMVSPLINIYEELGREATDEIITEALYFLTASSSMPDMANYIIKADSALNGGSNSTLISQAFVDQGILDKILIGTEELAVEENFRLLNTYDFAQGGSLSINCREQQTLSRARLLNINGQLLRHLPVEGKRQLNLSSAGLKPGVYLLWLEDNSGAQHSYKLSRLKP